MKKNDSNNEPKILLILRWGIPIFIFPISLFFINDINLFFCNLNNWFKYFISVVILIIVFLLIMLYEGLISKFWNFLKKDSIVHYIFLAAIPAIILFFGYQITKSPNHSPTYDLTQYDEIIDRLNGFYSSLFTAIAVIAAILALGAWRTIKELREKLEKFKEVEGKVDFLHKKKDLAKWVQDLFDKNEEKPIISSAELILSPEDKDKFEKIKERLIEDATDEGWLMIFYAKLLMQNNHAKIKGNNFEKVEKIYDFIEKRDLLKEDSDIKSTLFHLWGLLYSDWYNFKKKDYINKEIVENPDKKWDDWWSNNENDNLLKESKTYYEKSLEVRNSKNETSNETLGNLAIVLIELSKFQTQNEEKNNYLKEALTNLNQRKKDFNTNWDSARAKYYLDPKANVDEYKQLLILAAEDIDSIKVKKDFIDGIENEIKEKNGRHYSNGFPGDESLIKMAKDILNKKTLS